MQEIKLLITTEIRKLINKTVHKREMCIDDLDDYETTSEKLQPDSAVTLISYWS